MKYRYLQSLSVTLGAAILRRSLHGRSGPVRIYLGGGGEQRFSDPRSRRWEWQHYPATITATTRRR